ncbi:DUF397 domain-containing protein [Streptomyces sp. NPDC002870]|uniref:DUF397 domain-containing protein n=1 Tax=Streptomyces sp. NPDC002870 TaxID=3364666 RepID=UPI00369D31FC
MHRHDIQPAEWFKSSYSGGSGTECVEVAASAADVAVRDSKVPHGARLDLRPSAWGEFAGALREGRLSRPDLVIAWRPTRPARAGPPFTGRFCRDRWLEPFHPVLCKRDVIASP